jgi:methionyl-tRNA formyltransferase
MKIIYAGCNFFSSVLDEILSNPNNELLLCLTTEESPETRSIARLCRLHDTALHYGPWSPSLLEIINDLSADLLLSAAYPFLVPVEQLTVNHCVNLHPSLLPAGRGPNPLPKLITDKGRFSGLTLHSMTPRFDDGPIILQTPIAVDADESYDTLAMKMFIEAPKLVRQFFKEYPDIIQTAKPQQNGEYWPCCSGESRTINWYMGVSEILELHRQYGAFGLIMPFNNGLKIEATNIIGIRCSHNYPTGEVVMDAGSYLYIALHDGMLRILSSDISPHIS